MKKVFQSRVFLLVALIMILASAFTFIAYTNSHTVCPEGVECSIRPEPGAGSEMLWDILSRQFVSAVRLP
ncbi:MAG TPA: hypothetical protein VFS22_07835 [Flavisolibacter sp.]|nr:hypothetical protein [Flavisolibacter sp.]